MIDVLIIEDDHDTTQIYQNALKDDHVTLRIAHSAKEGLYRLAISEPDIVLLDMRLGNEVNGDDILLQIRTNPRFDETSVLVSTAYPEMVHPIADLVDLVLIKPIETEQLKSLVKRMANLRRSSSKRFITDPVTGLYNRQFFHTRLEHAIERARRRPEFLFATSVLELQTYENNRRVENGISGAILRQAGERLKSSVRPTDTVACLIGKTFATLHEDLKRPEDIQVITDRIQRKLAKPIKVNNHTYRVEVFLGAVVHDKHYTAAREMLEKTEETMQLARRKRDTGQLIIPAYGLPPTERIQ
jgi:diguanylate cyclase (GGDEF)-like protein